jgi:hypothetical protein
VNDLLKYLTNKLDKEIQDIETNLPTGQAEDYAKYRYMCGVYRGLWVAKNIINETSERMDENDE